jgi:hypothetical protein
VSASGLGRAAAVLLLLLGGLVLGGVVGSHLGQHLQESFHLSGPAFDPGWERGPSAFVTMLAFCGVVLGSAIAALILGPILAPSQKCSSLRLRR